MNVEDEQKNLKNRVEDPKRDHQIRQYTQKKRKWLKVLKK